MNITNLGAGLFEKSYAWINKGHLLIYVYLVFVYVSSLFIFLEFFGTTPLEGHVIIRDIVYYRFMAMLFGLFFKGSIFLFVYAIFGPCVAGWLTKKRLFLWSSLDIFFMVATFALSLFTGCCWFYYDAWLTILNYASAVALEQLEAFGNNACKVAAMSPVGSPKSPTSLAENLKDSFVLNFPPKEIGEQKVPVKARVYVSPTPHSEEEIQNLRGKYSGVNPDATSATMVEEPCRLARGYEKKIYSEPVPSGFKNRFNAGYDRFKATVIRSCSCLDFFRSRTIVEVVASEPNPSGSSVKPVTPPPVRVSPTETQSLLGNSPGNSPTEGHLKNSFKFPFWSSKK